MRCQSVPLKYFFFRKCSEKESINNVAVHAKKSPGWPGSSQNHWNRVLKSVVFCIGLAGIGLAAFLSLRSSPAISTVRWIPQWLSHWADAHGRFDNFPAYGLVSLPFYLISSHFGTQLSIFLALATFVVLLECVQILIPSRHCDGYDMVWGILGVLAAWMAVGLLRKGWTKLIQMPNPKTS